MEPSLGAGLAGSDRSVSAHFEQPIVPANDAKKAAARAEYVAVKMEKPEL